MAMQVSDITNVINGMNDSSSVFYAFGAGILTVLAGIWGFNRVKHLLGFKTVYYGEIEDIPEEHRKYYRFE